MQNILFVLTLIVAVAEVANVPKESVIIPIADTEIMGTGRRFLKNFNDL
jgi:hypothetical protein